MTFEISTSFVRSTYSAAELVPSSSAIASDDSSSDVNTMTRAPASAKRRANEDVIPSYSVMRTILSANTGESPYRSPRRRDLAGQRYEHRRVVAEGPTHMP